jgi:chaperone modulatory protein CbpM
MDTKDFLSQAQLDTEALEVWVEAGWLIPHRLRGTRHFTEIDLARARLIHDLKQDIGVNDEGISVVLDLLDQIHGLRRTLNAVLSAAALTHPELEHDRTR